MKRHKVEELVRGQAWSLAFGMALLGIWILGVQSRVKAQDAVNDEFADRILRLENPLVPKESDA